MPAERPTNAPRGANTAQVFALPRQRAPHHDAEASGALDAQSDLLKAVNVLIVEDDFIVAFDMKTLLEAHGAKVVGPAEHLAEARALMAAAGSSIHVAVLDVNLNGEYVFPIATELHRMEIPFLFATAYADDDRLFPGDLKSVVRLSKPMLPNLLVGSLKRLLG